MPTKRPQVVGLLLCGLLLGAHGLVVGAHANAQPSIRVASGSRLQLEASRTAQVVRARATLTDDQGRGIGGALITLSAERADDGTPLDRSSARTSPEGLVELEIASPQVLVRLRARFAGDDYHSEAEALETIDTIDTMRAGVALAFIAPASSLMDLGNAGHAVSVRARSESSGSGLSVRLEDELGRLLGHGSTNDEGLFELALSSAELGEPGIGKLIAISAADAQRSAGREEISVLRFRATQLVLTVARHGRSRIRVGGALLANKRGLAHATIGLFDQNGSHIASVETDAHGKLDQEIDLAELLAGGIDRETMRLEGSYVSSVPWLGSSNSAPIELSFASTRRSDLAWLIGTPIGCLLLLAWLRTRRRGSAPLEPDLTNASAGIALTRSSLSPLAPTDLSMTVMVLDAKRGVPISNALARVTCGNNELEAHSNARGELRVESLPRGLHRVRFEAAGYRALQANIRVPHRGEWTNAVVRLESLRDIAVGAWSQVAMRVWRSDERARATTVRETLQRAQLEIHTPSTLERTERAAYGRSIPSEPEVLSIEGEAAKLTETRDGRAASATGPRDESKAPDTPD